VYALRQAFYSAVSQEDLVCIVRSVVERAKTGDIAAAKVVLDWTIGRPGAMARFGTGQPWIDALVENW
jgi:hypothetical protein